MSWNHQGSVRSNDYNFADFGSNKLETLHEKASPHELSTESKANRMNIRQEMPEILENFDPWEMNHAIRGGECWIS
jgi:hypothetical protein